MSDNEHTAIARVAKADVVMAEKIIINLLLILFRKIWLSMAQVGEKNLHTMEIYFIGIMNLCGVTLAQVPANCKP